MKLRDKVVEILENNKEKYISGEQIAEELNVTRSAVCKVIKNLKDEGYKINAITKKGYCLEKDSNILSCASIKKYLKNMENYADIIVYRSVESTNDLAKKMASEKKEEGTVIVAQSQTKGKGRLGRKFFSPENTGIYMSIIVRPKITAIKSMMLTTMTAVAVYEAIKEVTGKDVGIKWVNDIFLDGKKICGILTEASVSMESYELEYAVVGIGINMFEPQDKFPKEIEDIATYLLNKDDVYEEDVTSRLIARILDIFMMYYKNFDNNDYVRKYKEASFVIGKEIIVISGDEKREAMVLDIDDECRLEVCFKDNREKQILSSGEISLRVRD